MNSLRTYLLGTTQHKFYTDQHRIQTYDYVIQKHNELRTRPTIQMTMKSALEKMDEFIDPSDPDTHSENSIHAYQTAERIRNKYPDDKELQICGLIHDLGKVLFSFGEPSIAVVGDTYVVGCEFPKSIVYYETMKENPDFNHPIYSDKNGVYTQGCGIENLKISFGHDDYLYHVLQNNAGHKLSIKYQNIIRFHSLYPWHTGKDYMHFMKEGDEIILNDVLSFNQFDLYSKEDVEFVLTDEIKKYYENLLNEYFPTPLNW